MSCGIASSPCENTRPSSGTQLVQWRVTVTAPLRTPPLFSTGRVSPEEGERFSSTHQRQFMLHILYLRKTMTVVWRQTESQWNTVAYSIILVVMETAELTKSVKWLQGMLVTKLIIRENASVQLRPHFTKSSGQKYLTCLFIQSGEGFLACLKHPKLHRCCPFSVTQQLELIVQAGSCSDLLITWRRVQREVWQELQQ